MKEKKSHIGLPHLVMAAALAAPLAAHAQDAAEDAVVLDPISLSASTQPVAVSRTGAAVTVLTADEIEGAGTLSFGRLLASTPGVSFDSSGGLGTTSGLRIRGLPGYYTGSRLDGFDVSDTAGTQFQFNFNSLTTFGIGRVEVLRGAQSALYGSEAIAGVVDITTFRPERDGTSGRAALEVGSDGTYSGSLATGYRDDRVELAFTASRTITDGAVSAVSGGVEKDGYQGSLVAGYAAYRLTDDIRIGANLLWRKTHADYDNGLTDEIGTYQDSTQRGGRVFAEFTTGALSHELSVSRLTNDRVEASGVYGATAYDGSRNELAWRSRWTASEVLSLNFGVEDVRETMVSGYGDAGKASTRSVYAEALYAPTDDLDLSFALRHDEHDDFGGKVTGRAAAAWRVAPEWTIRGVAATGFRAPSLYELYSDYGSSDLNPEKSRSFELGIERAFGEAGYIKATLFDTKVKNRILWDDASMACASAIAWSWPGCYAQIDGDTRSKGVEIEARYALSDAWALSGNYTYTDAKDVEATGTTRASRIPRHSLNLGVEGAVSDKVKTGLFLRHVADNYESAGPLGDYTLVDVSLGYAVSDAVDAYLRVENLFDKDYHTAYGYDQPGRQVFVGVRAAF